MAKARPTALVVAEPQTLAANPDAQLDEAYDTYLKEIGVRDPARKATVQQAYSAATDIRFRDFYYRASHPILYKKTSLAKIARDCGIKQHEMAEFWQNAQKQKALAIAQNGITDFIVPDMVGDARSKLIPCDRCDGFGWVYADDIPTKFDGIERLDPRDPKSRQIRACPLCKGSGQVQKSGDTDSRKMLLEMAGLTNKKGSVVQIHQNFGGMGMESAVDRLNRVSFSVEDAIDIESTPVSPQNSESES